MLAKGLPLTALAIYQGADMIGYTRLLSTTVGHLIWFGSSAGVAAVASQF